MNPRQSRGTHQCLTFKGIYESPSRSEPLKFTKERLSWTTIRVYPIAVGNTMWYGFQNTAERHYMVNLESTLGRFSRIWHVAEKVRLLKGIWLRQSQLIGSAFFFISDYPINSVTRTPVNKRCFKPFVFSWYLTTRKAYIDFIVGLRPYNIPLILISWWYQWPYIHFRYHILE